jgi:hypothetical protein
MNQTISRKRGNWGSFVMYQKILLTLILLPNVIFLSGCGSAVEKLLNPLQVDPPPEAYLGQPNSDSLNGSKNKTQTAREALEGLGSYQQQFAPSPNKPVLRPAIVRMMWIPDHLNKHGDMVPAHFYYLKVKSDEWAVQDAFDVYDQLNASDGTTNGTPSTIPYVTGK